MPLCHLLLAWLQQLRVPLPLDQLLLLLRLGVGLDGEAALQHGVVPAVSRSHKCGKQDRQAWGNQAATLKARWNHTKTFICPTNSRPRTA